MMRLSMIQMILNHLKRILHIHFQWRNYFFRIHSFSSQMRYINSVVLNWVQNVHEIWIGVAFPVSNEFLEIHWPEACEQKYTYAGTSIFPRHFCKSVCSAKSIWKKSTNRDCSYFFFMSKCLWILISVISIHFRLSNHIYTNSLRPFVENNMRKCTNVCTLSTWCNLQLIVQIFETLSFAL